MGRVIVFGSINLDTVLHVPHIVQPGETVSGYTVETFPGGKGGNQALAAHNAGADVMLIGKVGNDAAATEMLAFYDAQGLPTASIGRSDRPTGMALIQVERDGGENAIVVIPGANGDFAPADLEAIDLASGDVVMSMFEVPMPAIETLFRRARETGAETILNPSPAHPCPPALLAATRHLLINETELALLSGHPVSEASSDGFIAAAVAALERPADQTVIVTRGQAGARAFADGEMMPIQGRRVAAVDTTGAGDCFTGVYAARIGDGDKAIDAMVYANAAAAISVTRHGAASSMPSHAEIEAIVRHEP